MYERCTVGEWREGVCFCRTRQGEVLLADCRITIVGERGDRVWLIMRISISSLVSNEGVSFASQHRRETQRVHWNGDSIGVCSSFEKNKFWHRRQGLENLWGEEIVQLLRGWSWPCAGLPK